MKLRHCKENLNYCQTPFFIRYDCETEKQYSGLDLHTILRISDIRTN